MERRKCSAGGNAEDQEFCYDIAKFSQGLRNFAMIAKISQCLRNFAIIAKITVRSEIQIFAMPAIFSMIAKFCYHREISLYSESYCA